MRSKFERFCFKNRNKGIPNLMLYIVLGTAVVYIMTQMAQNYVLYALLCFDRTAILHGQVWRLITYPLTFDAGGLLFTAISLLCYYSIGRAMENIWGTLRFNLFYLTGIVMMDIFCLIFGGRADVYYLNMSLFLSYATLFPDAQFLLMFIIPVRAWIFALLDLILVFYGLIAYPFPYNLFPVVALANYFLFFGKDVLNVIPLSWRANARRLFRKTSRKSKKAKPIVFPSAGSYEATTASVQAPYTHRCTVCGRTDVSNPELEFRYCSKCKGYHCYCQDHINNHAHIQ
ncbi:MAG TPA: rhomboid family intramembrane serine protease [Candidatus Faecousia intestinigallinarum]|nr:rhomboid family intramembrane serine protease [Candidatus Faecousia intestinigallinarum]